MVWYATIDSWLARRDDGEVSIIHAPEVSFTDTHMHERHHARRTVHGDSLLEAREAAWQEFVKVVLPSPEDVALVYAYKLDLTTSAPEDREP